MIENTDALLPFAALSVGQTMAPDVAFGGNLFDKPCHASGDSLNKHVVLKIRASRDFWYLPGRPPTESLVIRLENCHATAVGKIMTLTFRETEEAALLGHLRVTGVNAGRLGTALLDTDGSSLLKPGASRNEGQGEKVTGNNPELPFGAYVMATPEVLWAKGVVPGDYETTAASELIYRWQNFCTGYFR